MVCLPSLHCCCCFLFLFLKSGPHDPAIPILGWFVYPHPAESPRPSSSRPLSTQLRPQYPEENIAASLRVDLGWICWDVPDRQFFSCLDFGWILRVVDVPLLQYQEENITATVRVGFWAIIPDWLFCYSQEFERCCPQYPDENMEQLFLSGNFEVFSRRYKKMTLILIPSTQRCVFLKITKLGNSYEQMQCFISLLRSQYFMLQYDCQQGW